MNRPPIRVFINEWDPLTLTTSYGEAHSILGEGLLFGFILRLNSDSGVSLKLTIDEDSCFELNLSDFRSKYNPDYNSSGLYYSSGLWAFRPPHSIRFNLFKLEAKKSTGTRRIDYGVTEWGRF